MINYVNNSFDKVLKPCDAQQFMTLTQSEQTERLILGHRAGEKNSKAKLPAITYMGVLDSDKYRKYLDQCKEQGTKPLGSRRAEFMRPTGLLMLDFDHVGDPTRDGVIPTKRSAEGSRASAMNTLSGDSARSFASAQDDTKGGGAAIDSPVKLWEYIKSFLTSHPSFGGEGGGPIALAHITPSGDGLRVVVKRTKGMSIEQEQYEFCRAMELDKVGIRLDDVCKDISRLSFAPMHKEVLYYNPSLLFAPLPEASDYPDGTIFSGVSSRDGVIPSEERGLAQGLCQGTLRDCLNGDLKVVSHSLGMTETDGASYDTEYRGVPYSEIVSRLEEQLGGRPEHGARNSFVFTMACNLRYVCNDDAQWIASILPTYGEDPQKHRMTIQSAVNRPMSRTMPETLKRALGVAKMCSEGGKSEIINHKSELPPAMPKALPALMELLTSRAPERMKAAVAMSVFPPLGAHLHEVKVVYADGREYEPTFMNVLVGELSSGKSAVNAPIEYIIADIEARDEVALEKEAAWKERCATLKTTEDKPTRPKGLAVQIMPADMTNAAFVQKLVDAEGKFLYTQMDEIELLNALKTGGNASMMSAVLRLAFDCGKYGQSRVAANAVSARVRVRWNWNASSTVQRVRKYFAKNIADGTLSRLSFATILKDEDDWGHKMPKFAVYGQPFADALAPYIDRLTTCKGTLHCPEAAAWAEALCQDLVTEAEKMDDRPYAQFAFRAVLMGFFRAMVLYIMEGMQWTQAIADFAAWSVRYDMWCKMRFFADMLRSDLEGEQTAIQRGRANLLTLLPDEFTREQVRDVRVAQGMKPNPKNMLAQWVSRGYIKLEATRGVYVKC